MAVPYYFKIVCLMKKILNILCASATIVLALASCQKEIDQPQRDGIRFHAGEIKTKTAFGTLNANKYPTLWTSTNDIKISQNKANSVSASVTPASGGTTAEFTPASKIVDDGTGSYVFYALSPASAQVSNINNTTYFSWNVEIPANQTPLANSVDESAQVLFARYDAGSIFPSDVNFAFRHVTAYGKFSLANLALDPGEAVTSITLTSPENWVGRWYYYVEDNTSGNNAGDLVASSASKIINITTDKTENIWFACAPVDLQNQSIDIIVSTTLGTFSKSVTFPSGKGNFEAGKIGAFTVDMSTATHNSLIATLPFSIDGTGGNAAYLSTEGLSASGLGSDYNASHTPYLTKLDGTDDYIQVRFNEPAGKAAIGVKMIGGANTSYIDVKGSADGETFSQIEKFTISGAQNDIKAFETAEEIDGSYRYIRFVFTKGSNIGVGPISITKPSTDPEIKSADILDIPVVGVTTTTTYTIKNFAGADDVTVKSVDGNVVTAATVTIPGTVSYTVAPNYGTSSTNGTITLTSATEGVDKVINVTQSGETFTTTASATIILAKNSSSDTFTITTPSFGWASTVTPGDGMNLTITPSSGSANASAQTITINSTTVATASEQTLGTIVLYRNSNTSDDQKITVTVKKAANVVGTSWVETALSDLTSSDEFVIVGNGRSMSNGNGTSSAPTAAAVTVSAGKITSSVTDAITWTLSGNSTDGYTFYPKGSTTTWLYCNTTASSGSNNNMRVGTGARKVFILEAKDGKNYLVTKDSNTKRYICVYNNSDWRGYVAASVVATDTKFYKKVTE